MGGEYAPPLPVAVSPAIPFLHGRNARLHPQFDSINEAYDVQWERRGAKEEVQCLVDGPSIKGSIKEDWRSNDA